MKKFICTLVFILCFGISVQARELQTKENVSPNKIWTINLNYPLDNKTVDNIRVYDSLGNIIQVEKMLTFDGRKITVEPKDGAWGRGINYTLEIKNIKSTDGKESKEPVVLKFTTSGMDFEAKGDYKDDEQYIFDKINGQLWTDGNKKLGYKAYEVLISKTNGILEVNLDVDSWGTNNIVDSKENTMKYQIAAMYEYLSKKYPNEKIRIGIWYNEKLNKYPQGLDSKHVRYNEQTGKYHVMFLLGARYETGEYSFATEGN